VPDTLSLETAERLGRTLANAPAKAPAVN
jgi:hypothetical protein